MNTITIQWSEEDRARIDTLIEKLDKLSGHDCQKCADSFSKYIAFFRAQTATETVPADGPTGNTPEPEAPAEPAPAPVVTPKVVLADVQKKVVELSAAGKKEQVREIVNNYAARVSAIPEDKLAEVLAKLTALEG